MARSTASFLSSSTWSPPWHSISPSAKSMAERYADTPVKVTRADGWSPSQDANHRVGQQPAAPGQHDPPGAECAGIGQPVYRRHLGGTQAGRPECGDGDTRGQPGFQHDP